MTTVHRPTSGRRRQKWQAPPVQVGDQAIPTILEVGDVYVPSAIRHAYAWWTTPDARAVCLLQAAARPEDDPMRGILEGSMAYSVDVVRAHRTARAGEAHATRGASRDLNLFAAHMGSFGIVRCSVANHVSVWGFKVQITEADCIVAMARSEFPSWQRLDTSNRKVIAAFKVGDNQALSITRTGPLVRIDLWRGESIPLSRSDRGGFLTVDEAVAFAHRRFS